MTRVALTNLVTVQVRSLHIFAVDCVTGTSLELPMDTDQATKFLDEHDLHDVLNKMPDEAFDLLTGVFSCSCPATDIILQVDVSLVCLPITELCQLMSQVGGGKTGSRPRWSIPL